ncbi:IS256 family transposase [Paracoccus sp. S-4012]|uniref:IS256 family transposase n=1 Tax=Paracoccus sp. S-4012 TaxID=2665648 RepID=UPI0012B135A0|nr:IS256 family transposase [Paracoccus sp. S-4012]MRX51338.1 IS256 family transposase [Paracoccus sp. S-4012]
MTITPEVLDELLKGCERPEDLLGEAGLMTELKRALMQRMLGAELTEHLGYAHGETPADGQANRRNGSGRKMVKGKDGAMEIAVPRDRDGSFEPQLIRKGQTRIDGLDDKIIALYARGMSVRDIRAHLEELYGLEVSPDLVSRVTDAVMDEVREWRSRALDAVYPVVIFDALRVKIRDKDSRVVRNKAVYIALGITGDGQREVLGLWIADTEGAKFWLSVMTELRNRGLQDILIAVVDGLKGFPEAITVAFPEATVQTCIVHLVRHSLNFCSWKDRKAVAARLREVYGAETAEAAEEALEAFDEAWGGRYPSIAQAWRRAWPEVIPFFAFGPEIRRVIYTTNAVESLNRVIRKAIKTLGSFPSEEAAEKLIYLAIREHEKTARNVRGWLTAVNQFAIMFDDRFNPLGG